jgi:hypothetical protein
LAQSASEQVQALVLEDLQRRINSLLLPQAAIGLKRFMVTGPRNEELELDTLNAWFTNLRRQRLAYRLVKTQGGASPSQLEAAWQHFFDGMITLWERERGERVDLPLGQGSQLVQVLEQNQALGVAGAGRPPRRAAWVLQTLNLPRYLWDFLLWPGKVLQNRWRAWRHPAFGRNPHSWSAPAWIRRNPGRAA